MRCIPRSEKGACDEVLHGLGFMSLITFLVVIPEYWCKEKRQTIMWPKAKISGKTNKGQTNLFKTILTKCFSYARSNSCYIPGKSLKYIKEYIQMLTFNHLNEEESILFGHLTYTNSSRHGTTWKSIRTVSIDMVPPKKQDNISFALFTDFASNAVVLVSQRSLENHIYSPVSPFN